MKYLAHIADDGREQTLADHSSRVAKLAGGYAEAFGGGDEAEIAGQYHDIGKYSPHFQARLHGSSEKYEHSAAGAKELYDASAGTDAGLLLAADIISGHHTGLPDFGTKASAGDGATFYDKLRRSERLGRDYGAYVAETGLPSHLPPLPQQMKNCFSMQFYGRMLFSCLVDADRLDTARFMSGAMPERCSAPSMTELRRRLLAYIANSFGGEPDKDENRAELNRCRTGIRRSCENAGAWEQGIYRLTVPTGGGKTIASMSFALEHAVRRGLRRVIYVIPYISIIKQTVETFKAIFGADSVLAHYSTAEREESGQGEGVTAAELAAENWDAPIIVTTNVQFFESLCSDRTSACRKLHNIAQSVIVFDEAQAIPLKCLRMCVRCIKELAANYGCTELLCTATQPALGSKIFGLSCRELCPNVAQLHGLFRRVSYQNLGTVSDAALTEALSAERSFLCVVNTRAAAAKLYSELKAVSDVGLYHLSTHMTQEHIGAQLDEIRSRLKPGLPTRVVSTSLVEAGVDVDFPTVFRELTGLDSIVQAAGRCNRENRRRAEDSKVFIFRRADASGPAETEATVRTERVLEKYAEPDEPDAIEEYFMKLYKSIEPDKTNPDKQDALYIAEHSFLPYRSIADGFKLIEETSAGVFIPGRAPAELADAVMQGRLTRDVLRRTGQYTASVSKSDLKALEASGCVSIHGGLVVLEKPDLYDNNLGLM